MEKSIKGEDVNFEHKVIKVKYVRRIDPIKESIDLILGWINV